MKTIFEESHAGNRAISFAPLEVKECRLSKENQREGLSLPEVSELELVRHFTALSRRSFGVDNGFYPLGSCTMKYNPKINDEVAAFEGFANAHPLSRADRIQGSLEVVATLSAYLAEITGMDAFSLQPCAGAQGEYAGLLLIKKYHIEKGDTKRTKMIVPDSAHGTNPASASMAGFDVVSVKSDEQKGVDLEDLKRVVGDDTAGLMLTNPTTLGLFEKNISEIASIVHDKGGLLYYDGANLNAIMGIVRPGDMGFDVVHLNLHKTFSTPHGGGGPGSGPVGCKEELSKYLPNPCIVKTGRGYRFKFGKDSIGKLTAFYGNFSVYVKALAYIVTLGGEGLKEASEISVLNANYLRSQICELYPTEKGRYCMHEFVVSLENLKNDSGVSALDIAKGMIDAGVHPPTMYFPLIVPEALMFEPTETESRETLDKTAKLMKQLYVTAQNDSAYLHSAPHTTCVSRPDEASAARNPKLRFVE